MDPITAFLLSMEAAGAISSIWENKSKMKTIQQGRQLEKAQYESNMEALQYESNQDAIASMKQLRLNLGTQMAVNAARGTQSGVGTAATLSNQSVSSYKNDEQRRRMNLLAKEANLRATNVLSGLHTLESETQLGRASFDVIKSLPTSSAVDQFRRSDLGKRWGFGLSPA
jgi:hypothetical protein